MTRATDALRPDSLLYIYYLAGKIPKDYRISHDAFLGNWEEDDFSFLFFLEETPVEVETLIARWPQLQLLDTYQMTYADWQGGSIEPLHIGRFILQPPWETVVPQEGEIALTLNSGVVFGNGTHPTTHDCLEAIEIACRGNKVQTMYDLGTGTGVLALAAAKLGCPRCLAVDFNHLAATTAQTNVRLNGLEENILVVNGRAEELLSCPSDLLVANIHYAVMKDIVRSEGFLRQKWFVLSGLLNSEAEQIRDYLRTQPVLLLKQWHQNGVWNTILGITENN
ncbi:50S ribosomal protein L11 methyltransferase [Desulfopila aestuarii]|uniref:Ribosomal protein L11 methyltransferase n=1 Tax=Desulfopila aestuarii DSM 18488 TaxID=1121416 RepID=A0A1M7Y767_9BACT|nr:50S ribosomal protein L11 methyltransferase [Desulfopila aestuarii]SHO48431.1 ribosomal protein L11 methyltransferase [Desulfopila aestuarii DSM 18488]